MPHPRTRLHSVSRKRPQTIGKYRDFAQGEFGWSRPRNPQRLRRSLYKQSRAACADLVTLSTLSDKIRWPEEARRERDTNPPRSSSRPRELVNTMDYKWVYTEQQWKYGHLTEKFHSSESMMEFPSRTFICSTTIAGLWMLRRGTMCSVADILRLAMRKHHERRT